MGANWSADVIADVERWSAEAGDPPDPPEYSRHVLDGLLDRLRAAGPAPLAQALAERRLAGAPTSEAEADGLAGTQAEAVRACLSPGLRAVWARPAPARRTC